MKDMIKMLLKNWEEEYNEIKSQLIIKGDDAGGFEYNILATEAMRLNECRLQLTELLL